MHLAEIHYFLEKNTNIDMSLLEETVVAYASSCISVKEAKKFEDFSDRVDINQNQKKKHEIARLQLKIKQGLGKELYRLDDENVLGLRQSELEN